MTLKRSDLVSSARDDAEIPPGNEHRAVIGNERLTALAGLILLGLIVIELVTTADLRSFMSAHVFVGVLLVGPLAVKLGSTGYRFVRYYTGSIAFVQKGPPRFSLRVLAVPLVAMTLVLVGSGGGLLVTGPNQSGPLIALHNVSTLIWLPMIAIHAIAYVRRTPRLIAPDLQAAREGQRDGARLRLGLNIGALVAGTVAAVLLLPADVPWLGWAQTIGQVPAPLVVGSILAVVALVVVRPLRWT